MSELYQIDFVEGVPVYRQLVDRIRANIKSGVMENGMQLPTVRELAGQLGLALGTVKRAYDELGKEGLVQQVQGRGCKLELLFHGISSVDQISFYYIPFPAGTQEGDLHPARSGAIMDLEVVVC